MKNTIKIFAIIAVVAVIMVGMAACGEQKTFTLTVVNNSSLAVNVNMSLGSEKWKGVLQTDESKILTLVQSSMKYTPEYSVTYGENNKVRTGLSYADEPTRIYITDANL